MPKSFCVCPRRRKLFAATLVWACALASVSPAAAADPLAVLSQVGPQGGENEAAGVAWQELSRAPADQLPRLLAALDKATPLGANWIRAAVDTIAERQLAQGGQLPLAQLEAFLQGRAHAPRARRLAFEWIVRADPKSRERLITGMLDDPSVELRREAVARVLDQAAERSKADNRDTALAAYRQALTAARDQDQVKTASEALKQLGEPVDLASHYGFVRNWYVIGPFDNADRKGFQVAYAPENAVDFKAGYEGKLGPVRWLAHTTSDELGQVDLNTLLGKHKGVIGYAVAELNSPREQPVEFRLGTDSANKIWLNGDLLFEREVYHAFVKMDQYIARGRLKAGRNALRLKICQNEQTEDWAGDWKFQLRVCDATGGAVALENNAASVEK